MLAARLKRWLGERRVNRAVRAAGFDLLSDVILPDGLGGWTQIDHIIKLPVCIAVIETKNYSGFITGGQWPEHWTRHYGRRIKYKCINPVRQNYGHVLAVKKLVSPDVVVYGLVVIVGAADIRVNSEEFSGLAELERHLRMVAGMAIPREVEGAWAVVSSAVRRDWLRRWRHFCQLRGLTVRRSANV